MRLLMRSLLLMLLLALLSFLAFVYVKRKSLRTAIAEGGRKEKVWKTEKGSFKREEKGEPWIKVVKRAERVRELCKEWGSERSFPLKQVWISCVICKWRKQIIKGQRIASNRVTQSLIRMVKSILLMATRSGGNSHIFLTLALATTQHQKKTQCILSDLIDRCHPVQIWASSMSRGWDWAPTWCPGTFLSSSYFYLPQPQATLRKVNISYCWIHKVGCFEFSWWKN